MNDHFIGEKIRDRQAWVAILKEWQSVLDQNSKIMDEPYREGERANFGFFKHAIIRVKSDASLLEEFIISGQMRPDAYLYLPGSKSEFLIESKDKFGEKKKTTAEITLETAKKQLDRYFRSQKTAFKECIGVVVLFVPYEKYFNECSRLFHTTNSFFSSFSNKVICCGRFFTRQEIRS